MRFSLEIRSRGPTSVQMNATLHSLKSPAARDYIESNKRGQRAMNSGENNAGRSMQRVIADNHLRSWTRVGRNGVHITNGL